MHFTDDWATATQHRISSVVLKILYSDQHIWSKLVCKSILQSNTKKMEVAHFHQSNRFAHRAFNIYFEGYKFHQHISKVPHNHVRRTHSFKKHLTPISAKAKISFVSSVILVDNWQNTLHKERQSDWYIYLQSTVTKSVLIIYMWKR